MATRGEFLSAITMSTAISALPAFPSPMRKPPMLRRGDRIGLIAPASPLAENEIVAGLEHVRLLRLEPVLGDFVRAHDGYLAGTDEERAADFNRMARDSAIRGIFALRGGYGTMRILDRLDYAAIAADPKVIMGFSDITAVLNAVARRSRVITFHGPVASRETTFDPVARAYIEQACMSTDPIGELRAPDATVIAAGRARGPIAGGNLSLVSALVGTPWVPAIHNSLLLLEETDEQPYRIDRMLTQLRLAGVFKAASGVIFGACTNCLPKGPSFSFEEVLSDRLGDLGRPVISGVSVGHIPDQWVLPIGLEAELDAQGRTLRIAEPAVTRSPS